MVRDDDMKNKLADILIAVRDRPNRAANAIKSAAVLIVACAELGK